MDGITAALTGRTGTEPELRYTAGGTATLGLSVAVESKAAEKDGQVEWCRVTVWKERAEELSGQLHKGDLVYAEGRLKMNTWAAANGEQRSGLNLSAWTLHTLGKIGEHAPKRPQPTPAATLHPVSATGRPDPWPGAAG